MDLSQETQVAIAAVREAMAYCRAVQDSFVTDALTKDDRSPVTIADYGAQAIICRRIHDGFPADAILAEERATDLMRSGEMGQRLCQAIRAGFDPSANLATICEWIDAGGDGGGDRRWIIDPVDGTKGFLRREQYAIALALIVGGRVRLGVLGCPNLPDGAGHAGCMFAAVEAGGARQLPPGEGGGAAVHVTGEAAGPQMVFVESVESGHTDHATIRAIVERLGVVNPPVRYDSQAKYAVVARGEASAYLRLPNPETPDYREKVWDHVAGWLIVTEAGGRVTDIDGRDLDFTAGARLENNRGIVAGNGACHEAVLEAIRSAAGA